MTRRFWAMRADKRHPAFFFSELNAGRLRQGWGYKEEQDLKTIEAKDLVDGDRYEPLSPEQRDTRRHLKMLGTQDDHIQFGDVVLSPNLPEIGLFCLSEITGPYTFSIPPSFGDYGHTRGVRLLTARGVHKQNEIVSARLRQTLTARGRLWSLDHYQLDLERILEAVTAGQAVHEPHPARLRLSRALEAQATNLREHLANTLDESLGAAEWEQPLADALQRAFPTANVEATGGANEHGADIVVRLPNPFDQDNRDLVIVVQVKNHRDVSGDLHGLNQLAGATRYYGDNGIVVAAVLLTTASKVDPPVLERRDAVQKTIGCPVMIATRDQVLDLMLMALGSGAFREIGEAL